MGALATRVLLSVLVVVALTASPVAAKSGMRAWLMSPIPRWAEPGAVIHVNWIVRDDEGHSLNAIGVFVRLTSGAAGVEPNEGFASAGAHTTGEYEADVAVPEGGIGRIEFGLAGTISGPNMPARRSDMLFPIANLVWTPDAARPSGPPPPDGVTNRTTSTGPTAGAVLLTAIPLDAREGTRIRVLWRVRGGDGSYDFGSVGLFVRLTSRVGAPPIEAFSSPTRSEAQPYGAEVMVPRGGIASVEFGRMGFASGERSDRRIPIVDAIYTPTEIKPADAFTTLPQSDSGLRHEVLALIGLVVAIALAGAVVSRRVVTTARQPVHRQIS